MRTTISTTLAVAEYFDQAQFGEIVLEAERRSYQYTQTDDAERRRATRAFLADLAKRRIVLDDASNDQNDATTGTVDEPYFFPTAGLSTTNRVPRRRHDHRPDRRHGVRLRQLAPAPGRRPGLHVHLREPASRCARRRRRPAQGRQLQRPELLPIDSVGHHRPAARPGPGVPRCRLAGGAGAPARQDRGRARGHRRRRLRAHRDRERRRSRPPRRSSTALNAHGRRGHLRLHPRPASSAPTPSSRRSSTTRRPSSPSATSTLLTSADDPRFVDTRNRPSLIQTFDEVLTGERLTVSVNHLKSKGSGCGAGDDSPADGSGNCDLHPHPGRRRRSSTTSRRTRPGAVTPTSSSSATSTPTRRSGRSSTIEGAGYTNLLQRFEGADSYGYLFDGLLGDLDHALASTTPARRR